MRKTVTTTPHGSVFTVVDADDTIEGMPAVRISGVSHLGREILSCIMSRNAADALMMGLAEYLGPSGGDFTMTTED